MNISDIAAAMKSVSLRMQVVTIAAVLGLGAIGAIVITASTIRSARESIVRLNLDRLQSVTTELGRRYGAVIGFVAEEQFLDSSVAQRKELRDLLDTITREELSKYPDAQAGFFHSLWNAQLAAVHPPGQQSAPPAVQRFLRTLMQNALEQKHEQAGHYESGEINVIGAGTPVFARDRLIGVAWALDDLGNDLAGAWAFDLTPLLQVAVLVGLALAGFFVFNLRREVRRIQIGLDTMKSDLGYRLPSARTELGTIAGSINRLAETIVSQQREAEALQRQVQQNEKLAALGQLVAGVAHEIRTPLSLIKTRIQLWQRARRTKSRKPAVTRESMTMVLGELDRLEEIVRKLLYFSKQRTLRKQRLNMHEFLSTTLAALEDGFRKKKIRVERRFEAPQAHIEGDPAELREVFFNLLQNSLDATGANGTITVRTTNDNGYFLAIVEDDGAGVGETLVGKIFEPFFTTKEKGVGLGLPIAREIVRLHDGQLEYTGAERGGARFTVSLPCSPNGIRGGRTS
ncbi:MAG: hypothetical protein HBSIN02_18930 [Bacteroidia bacterium]|nr:MAG: hypothetical protein HBSIN02_18930 [Bacteroidia bacterium]